MLYKCINIKIKYSWLNASKVKIVQLRETDEAVSMSVGTTVQTIDFMKDYDYIIISCWAHTSSGGNRGFKIINTKKSVITDAGKESVYINGGIYYNPSYYASIGLITKSNTKGVTCGEVNIVGYVSLWLGEILGIKF